MEKLKKESKFKIPKSLVFFVILAFLFWGLINLSKTYETKQTFEVTYRNLPKDKLLQIQPQKEITLNLQGSGFKLFTSKIINKKIVIDAQDLNRKSKFNYYLLLPNQTKKIQSQLRSSLQINDFKKDTIFFSLGYLATKKIPIIPDYNLSFKAGFNLANKVRFDKDSITISGPEKTIDTINKLYLPFKNFENISQNIDENIAIKISNKLDNVRLSDSIVNIKIDVEKFTEGEVEIPFTISNLPKDITINTFPKTVKITFKVGLSKFNQVKASDYLVVCDYNYAKENDLSYLIPKLIKKSELLTSAQISPKNIEFLIQQ